MHMRFALTVFLSFSLGYSVSIAQTDTNSKIEITPQYLKKELPLALEKLEHRYTQMKGSCAIFDRLDYNQVPEKTKAKWKLTPDAVLPQGEQTIGKSKVSFAITNKFFKCEVTSDTQGVIDSVAGKERAKPRGLAFL